MGGDAILALREDVLNTLEEMRENLKETLKEASTIRRMAIEEEVLIGVESINKTCSNVLRHTREIEKSLRHFEASRRGTR